MARINSGAQRCAHSAHDASELWRMTDRHECLGKKTSQRPSKTPNIITWSRPARAPPPLLCRVECNALRYESTDARCLVVSGGSVQTAVNHCCHTVDGDA